MKSSSASPSPNLRSTAMMINDITICRSCHILLDGLLLLLLLAVGCNAKQQWKYEEESQE